MNEKASSLLNRLTVILHHTRSADNVGGTARAMANMGLRRLVLAEPAAWDRARARRVATEAADLLEEAAFVPRLEDALDETTLFIATSARSREGLPHIEPEEAANVLLQEAGRGGLPSLVFGDERSGLERWVLDRAFAISRIPTSQAATSLNLAQSVMVHAYILRRAAESGFSNEPTPASSKQRDHRRPRPAGAWAQAPTAMSAEDLARLRSRAKALLLEAGYLNPQQPDRILGELERLLARAKPTDREGKLLLALVRQLEWAVGR